MQLMASGQHRFGGLFFFAVGGNFGDAVGQFLTDADDRVEALLQGDVLLLQRLNAFDQTFGFISLTAGKAVEPAGLAQRKRKGNNRHHSGSQKQKTTQNTIERQSIHHCTHRDVFSQYA